MRIVDSIRAVSSDGLFINNWTSVEKIFISIEVNDGWRVETSIASVTAGLETSSKKGPIRCGSWGHAVMTLMPNAYRHCP